MTPTAPTEKLIQEILEAFSGSGYPGDDRLVYDNSGGHLECNQVAEAYRGRRWQEISEDFLLRQPDSLFFFTPEAYRYYLPAFMIATIHSYKKMDIVVHNLVHTLVPPAEDPERQYFDASMEGLTPRQREVIRHFLEYLINFHGQDFPRRNLHQAFENYWT